MSSRVSVSHFKMKPGRAAPACFTLNGREQCMADAEAPLFGLDREKQELGFIQHNAG